MDKYEHSDRHSSTPDAEQSDADVNADANGASFKTRFGILKQKEQMNEMEGLKEGLNNDKMYKLTRQATVATGWGTKRRKGRGIYGLKLPDGVDESDDEVEIGAGTLLNGFTEKTTSHGITHIFQAKGYLKKVIWIILSLVMLSLLIFHNWWLFTTYFQYGITTIITVTAARKLDFPAVTICNNNAVRATQASTVLADLSATIEGKDNSSETSPEDTATLFDSFISELAEATPAAKESAGHQLKGLLLYCTYNQEACDITTNFWHFSHPIYGNCYTFNSVKNGNPVLSATKSGSQHGLSITLHVQEYEYINLLTQSKGVHIEVHDPTIMPFPELKGLSASPGALYNIGIKETQVSRIPAPYTNCTSAANDEYNAYKDMFQVTYSQPVCFNTCYQTEVEAKCDCFDPAYPGIGDNARPCRSTVEETCKVNVYADYEEDKIDCTHCKEPCDEKNYDATISSLIWPADSYVNELLKSLNNRYVDLWNQTTTQYPGLSDEEIIRKNLLQVNIYYKALQYEKIEYSEAYSIYQFISDVGGCFGLWIGWSIMTMFEILELVSDALAVCMLNSKKKKKKKKANGGPGVREQRVGSA